jgi:serine-protein kinase ATM
MRSIEEREQIGTMITPFAQSLMEIEKWCLVALSAAARAAHMPQIALNSVIAAQRLEDVTSFDVSQEFASVLWHLKEQVTAVRYLRQLVDEKLRNPEPFKEMPLEGRRLWVKLLGQLVSTVTCMIPPPHLMRRRENG